MTINLRESEDQGTTPAAGGDQAAGTPGPLEPGDNIALSVDVDMWPNALDGEPGDVVVLVVPPGRGLLVEAWLRRHLTDTPDIQRERHEQDALARLVANGGEVW